MRVSAGPWEGSGASGEKQGSRAEEHHQQEQQQQQEQRDQEGGCGHDGIRAQGQTGGRKNRSRSSRSSAIKRVGADIMGSRRRGTWEGERAEAAAAAGAAQLQGWVEK